MGDSAGGGTELRFLIKIVQLKKLEEEREKNAHMPVQLEEVVRAS